MRYDHDSYINPRSKLQAVKFPELLLGDKPLELGTWVFHLIILLFKPKREIWDNYSVLRVKDVEPCLLDATWALLIYRFAWFSLSQREDLTSGHGCPMSTPNTLALLFP